MKWLRASAVAQGRAIMAGLLDPLDQTEAYLEAAQSHPYGRRIYARLTPDRARAEAIARERGIILADTKLEFGRSAGAARNPAGAVVLGDEVLTPDSSRFWPAAAWARGARRTPAAGTGR